MTLYEKLRSILALFAWAKSNTAKRSAVALAHISIKHRENLIVPIYRPKGPIQ